MIAIYVIAIQLISWFPVYGFYQSVVFVIPPAIGVLFLFSKHTWLSKKHLLLLMLIWSVTTLSALLNPNLLLINYGLGLLTFSSLFLILLRSGRVTQRQINTIMLAIAWISIFQLLVSFAQIYVFRNTDNWFNINAYWNFMRGTLGTNSHLFSVKMFFNAMFLFFFFKSSPPISKSSQRLLLIGFVAATLGCFLASFLSGIVIMIVGCGLLYSTQRRRRIAAKKKFSKILIGGVILASVSIIIVTQGTNIRLLQNTASVVGETMRAGPDGPESWRFGKIFGFVTTYERLLLSSPKNLFLGTGGGHYSSRAAMILSGEYLFNQPPWMPISVTPETENFILPRVRPLRNYPAISVMMVPFSTIQATLAETGVIGLLLFGFFWRSILRTNAALMKRESSESPLAPLREALPYLVASLIAVYFTDLWLEFPSLSIAVFSMVSLALSRTAIEKNLISKSNP